MAEKYWSQFYGKSYKGGSATIYVRDRFWNVKLEALSDNCAFTDGWSKLLQDLALNTRCTFKFTTVGYETFEVLFNHHTGTEMYFKKVEILVLDDPIYGDDGFDLLLASEHKENVMTNDGDIDQDVTGDALGDSMGLSKFESNFNDVDDSKFDKHIAAVIEMEALKNKVDPKGKSKVVEDKGLSTNVEPKGRSCAFVSDQKMCSHVISQNITMPSAKATPKSFSTVDLHTLVKISRGENKQAKQKCNASTSTNGIFDHKCSTSKKLKKNVVIQFTKKAESRPRLPTGVSSHLCLSVDNLHHVIVQNLKRELCNLGTTAEKSGNGFRSFGVSCDYGMKTP